MIPDGSDGKCHRVASPDKDAGERDFDKVVSVGDTARELSARTINAHGRYRIA
jgi:hypothetical protein